MKQFHNSGYGKPVHPEGIIWKHVKYLKDHGHVFGKYISDKYGKFGAIMYDSKDRLPFLLCSKGSKPWRGSCYIQEILFDTWKTIHVLGIQPKDEPVQFFVFDMAMIRLNNLGRTNYKRDVPMINFHIDLGYPWDPERSLAVVWQKVKAETNKAQSVRIDSYFT